MKRILFWLFGIGFTLVCLGLMTRVVVTATRNNKARREAATERAELARRNSKIVMGRRPENIVIGMVGPAGDEIYDSMARGVAVAMTEIKAAGGVHGRNFNVILKDDEGSLQKGGFIAQEFAENLDVVAVIGHPTPNVSLKCAIIYEYYGILYFAPTITNPNLTNQGFQRVFRNMPDNDEIAKRLADYAAKKNYRRMLVYYMRSDYGRDFANAFEREALGRNLEIRDRAAYDESSSERVFAENLDLWVKNYEFDAIFLAGLMPSAAKFVVEARRHGVTAPILTGTELDTTEFIRKAGKTANGVALPVTFDAESSARGTNNEAAAFVAAYRKRYGFPPDSAAAQGYDAMWTLARAMIRADSSAPDDVAAALRSAPTHGITGTQSYVGGGNAGGKRIIIKEVSGIEAEPEVPVAAASDDEPGTGAPASGGVPLPAAGESPAAQSIIKN